MMFTSLILQQADIHTADININTYALDFNFPNMRAPMPEV